jgi:hypothetical protein
MQINKQIITIVLLTSLLVSSIGVAMFFYKKHKQAQLNKDQMITVYIAKEDIPKDTLIALEHLAQTEIAKQYILNTPLLKEEIVGKFTNEKIFQHEIFIKQKLDTQLQQEEKKILEYEKSAYNVKFELFKNPNYALHQGEYINVVSVYPKGNPDNKGRYEDFEVEYVAKEVKVLGFIRDGRHESSTITKHKVRKIIDKKPQEVLEEIKSDELILDVDLKVLMALIKNYNKGTQLWMVKTKQTPKEVVTASSEDEINPQEEGIEEIVFERPVEYEYKMYTPKQTVISHEGLIKYANDKEGAKTKSQTANIVIDASALCSSVKEQFIVGTSRTFNLRNNPSLQGTIVSVLQKNTIIPYVEKLERWYKTCDNNYVHESVVQIISASQIEEKLGQYE